MIVPSIKGAATLNMGLFALIAPLLYPKLPGFQPVSHGTLSIEIARIGSNDQPIILFIGPKRYFLVLIDKLTSN